MGILEKIEKMLQGKKTYIIAVLTGVGVVLTILGIDIPNIVWPILGALGLGAIRSAVGKVQPPK